MTIEDQITTHFTDSISVKIESAELLPPIIAMAGEIMVQTLLNEGKILTCGNAASAAAAQSLACNLLNRFERERPSLPAICLTADTVLLSAIANDSHFNEVYAKQVRAIGQAGDVLVVISDTGNCANMVQAIQAAHDREMLVIALTANDGGNISSLIHPEDIEIRVPSYVPVRSQEVHGVIIHSLCDLVDEYIFGGMA